MRSRACEDPAFGRLGPRLLRLRLLQTSADGIISTDAILAKVTWGQSRHQEVSGLPELDEQLDAIAAEATGSILDQVTRANGDSLAIGLGTAGEMSVLSFESASLDPPFYVAVGAAADGVDAPDASDEYLVFFQFGLNHAEFHGKHMLALERARDAMREFVVGDGLPPSVRWETR